MKIYTRTGDKGETSLLGGERVSKADIKIESYGTVDELNSYLGLLRDQNELAGQNNILLAIQTTLFSIGSSLAVESGKSFDYIPEINESEILILEKEIDRIDSKVPAMKNFVLPGGHTVVSYCHIARCVCRRAERLVINLSNKEQVDGIIIKYLNRLSDYLFMLARETTNDLGIKEIPWEPRK